ncbi:hypothetical protein BC628DRAFT_1051248 [Trametes gibbosa]|nr:hypothetical protein BC628DRAFT_1051248 [Trametes gibbosa]
MILTSVLVTCLIAILGVFQQVSVDTLLSPLAHLHPSLASFTSFTSTALTSLLLVTGLDMRPALDAAPLVEVDLILYQLHLNASIGDGFASPDLDYNPNHNLNYNNNLNLNLDLPDLHSPIIVSESSTNTSDNTNPALEKPTDGTGSQSWWDGFIENSPVQIAVVLLILFVNVVPAARRENAKLDTKEDTTLSNARCPDDALYEYMQRHVAYAEPRIHMLSKGEIDFLATSRELVATIDEERALAAKSDRDPAPYDPIATMMALRPLVLEELARQCPTPPMAYISPSTTSTDPVPIVLPFTKKVSIPDSHAVVNVRRSSPVVPILPRVVTNAMDPPQGHIIPDFAEITTTDVVETFINGENHRALKELINKLPKIDGQRASGSTESEPSSEVHLEPHAAEDILNGVDREFRRMQDLLQQMLFDEEAFALGRLYGSVLHTVPTTRLRRSIPRILTLHNANIDPPDKSSAVGEG